VQFRLVCAGSTIKHATFGAGCFWGVEEIFRKLPGIAATRVGYMGGTIDNPTYDDVCTDTTGHVEVVEVSYDPSRISYDDLLDVFWQLHDPTSMDYQGPYEQGSQYRAVVFARDADQEAAARTSKAALERSGVCRAPIVTEIRSATRFWPAEDYHQRYVQKGGTHYCNVFNRTVTFPAKGKAEGSAQDG
jgi:peptide-methionine (S)-S-oxide reductase